MRILAGENFPRPIVESLRKPNHDVLWARTDCPGLKDSELLERAEADDRVLLTLDKDFWQLALQRRIPSAPGSRGSRTSALSQRTASR